jgi:hypothetical protein
MVTSTTYKSPDQGQIELLLCRRLRSGDPDIHLPHLNDAVD